MGPLDHRHNFSSMLPPEGAGPPLEADAVDHADSTADSGWRSKLKRYLVKVGLNRRDNVDGEGWHRPRRLWRL